jgi:lipopolysaccharide biosynthesis regulator YciM
MSITVISIIILLVILSFIAYINFDYSSKYKKTEKDLYYEALDLLLTGKLKEAYATLLSLIKNDTSNVKAYLKLGQVLREIGNPERALKIHRSLLIRKDLTTYEKIELLKNIALDYKHIKRINDSIIQCLDILKLEKKNEWALLELIDLYKSVDDWNSSQKYLERYQKITGNLDSRILGLYLIKQGQIEFDKKDFVRARSLFEEGLNMHNELGICYKLIGDTYSEESEIEYQKSTEDNNEESIEKAKELLSKALPMWVKYAQHKPTHSSNVIHLIKDSLFALDRYSELEHILNDLVERDSNNIAALITLADYYSLQGENEKSVNLLDSLKGKEKESILAGMVRLRLQFNISESVTDEMKDEFNNLTNEMSKTGQGHSSTLQDEDLEWLSENEYSEE